MSAHTARRLVLAALVLAGLVAVWWLYAAFEPHRANRRRQQTRFSFLKLGMPSAVVLREAGAADHACRGGESVRVLKGQLADDAARAAGEEELLQRLERETAEVLVYHFPEPSAERRRLACGPAYLDTAIGLDTARNVLWFTVLLGEDLVRHGRSSRPNR
ncbi:MAG: hypothetical protein ABR499_04140 [Gemmatimonadaceae bacterium]